MDVRLPNGTILRGVPEGTTKAQISAKLGIKDGNDAGELSAAVGGFNTAVPFGRKITSALGAGIAKSVGGITGEDFGSFGDLYQQAEADAQATAKANPKSNALGIGAGIVNTLPLALTNASQKIGSFATGRTFAGTSRAAEIGNSIAKPIKAAIVAAPGGAIYGAGEAETGDELQGAKRGAGLAAGVAASLPIAGAALSATGSGIANLGRGIIARNSERLDEAADAIKDVSGAGYKMMRDIGATFLPQARAKILNAVNTELKADGPLNEGLHGATMSIVKQLQDEMKQPGFSLEQLDQYRRLLSRVPRGNPEDVRKASIVSDALDDAVDMLKDRDFSGMNGRAAIDALKIGRQEYHRFSKFDRIAQIVKESGGDANKIKSGLQRFVNNARKSGKGRGFSKEELNYIDRMAKNSAGEGLLKFAGKFGIDLGSSLSVGNGGLPGLVIGGGALTGGAGPAGGVVAVGTAARQAQKWIARGKAENVLRMIENGQKVPGKQIMNLPPQDAKKILQILRNQTQKAPLFVEVNPKDRVR